jgi:hypothetical protein
MVTFGHTLFVVVNVVKIHLFTHHDFKLEHLVGQLCILDFTYANFSKCSTDSTYILRNLIHVCIQWKFKNAELSHQMFEFEIMVSKQMYFDDIDDHK